LKICGNAKMHAQRLSVLSALVLIGRGRPARDRHQATVSTNTPRSPVTPLSLKLRANVFKNEGKLGIDPLEASTDDEPSEVHRPCNTVGKLLAPLAWVALKACARLEEDAATLRYCWIGCVAFSRGESGVDGVSSAVIVWPAPPVAGAASISPSCVSADAIAEASGSATVVDEAVETAGAGGDDRLPWSKWLGKKPVIGGELLMLGTPTTAGPL
jgi:hypothetical protein